MKSLKNKNLLPAIKVYLLLVIALLTTSCGLDAEQINFERKALSPPKGITEMTVTGMPAENTEADLSDWRISPEFFGLIEVQTPAYPNPVSFNSTLSIDLYVSGIEAVNGLYAYVYRPQKVKLAGPIYVENQPLAPGLLTVTLAPQKFIQTGTGTANLYRIVIYDASNNIITYGDVKVK